MTQDKPLWAKIGLIVYCLIGGFIFKMFVGALQSWGQPVYHPLSTPGFWLATIFTAPVIFLMNRDRLDQEYDFKARLSAASYRLIMGGVMALFLLIPHSRPISFAEYMFLLSVSDAFLKFLGPFKPWDPILSRLAPAPSVAKDNP